MIQNLPKLFCEKGTVLRLKKHIGISENGSKISLLPGTLFQVCDIIGYGFDLVSLDAQKHVIRIMNSEMPDYFEKVDHDSCFGKLHGDAQLSDTGKKQLGHSSPSASYINVTQSGEIIR